MMVRKEADNGDINVTALNRLVDLAERYLQASEVMPEKRKVEHLEHRIGNSPSSLIEYSLGIAHNQCVDACTLALTKKLEGLEGILEGV